MPASCDQPASSTPAGGGCEGPAGVGTPLLHWQPHKAPLPVEYMYTPRTIYVQYMYTPRALWVPAPPRADSASGYCRVSPTWDVLNGQRTAAVLPVRQAGVHDVTGGVPLDLALQRRPLLGQHRCRCVCGWVGGGARAGVGSAGGLTLGPAGTGRCDGAEGEGHPASGPLAPQQQLQPAAPASPDPSRSNTPSPGAAAGGPASLTPEQEQHARAAWPDARTGEARIRQRGVDAALHERAAVVIFDEAEPLQQGACLWGLRSV